MRITNERVEKREEGTGREGTVKRIEGKTIERKGYMDGEEERQKEYIGSVPCSFIT